MNPSQSSRISSAVFLGAILAVLIVAHSFVAQDLLIYREAGLYLWSHKNPYLLPQSPEYLSPADIGFSDPRALQIWTPPFSLFIPIFLALLPPTASKILWLAMYVGAVTCGLSCSGSVGLPLRTLHVKLLLMLGFLPLILHGMLWGSVTPFAALPFFILVIVLSRKATPHISLSACLFLATFKPQLMAAPLMVYAFRVITQRQSIAPFLQAGALTFLALILSLHLRPSLFSDFRQIDRAIFFEHSVWATPFPSLIGAQPWVSPRLYLVVIVSSFLLLWILYRRTKHLSVSQQLLEASPFTFILIPYSWGHDFLILLPWVALVIHKGIADRSLLTRFLFYLGVCLWATGGWLLASNLELGHGLARYPINLAIIVWIAQRLIQLPHESLSPALGAPCCGSGGQVAD